MATKARPKRRVAANHLEAMKHPLRYDIWDLLCQRVMSPKELAAALDSRIDLVSHHTKYLVRLGCAEEVDRRQVRGAIEHFYKATERILVETDDWQALHQEDPRFAEYVVARSAQMQLDDIADSIRAGTLGTDEQFLLDRHTHPVDSQGVDELMELLERVEGGELVEIFKRSALRRAESGDAPVHVSVHLNVIKTPPPA